MATDMHDLEQLAAALDEAVAAGDYETAGPLGRAIAEACDADRRTIEAQG